MQKNFTKTFPSSSVSINISPADRKLISKISLMTIRNVTGNLEPFDWSRHAQNFSHLEKIPFIQPARGKVDLLIGLDNAHFHRCLREVHGELGHPIARLTPLGWTCVGNTGQKSNSLAGTRFVNTFFQKGLDELNESLKRFWEIDEINNVEPLSVIDKDLVAKSINQMRYDSYKGRYEVEIPWKRDPNELPNNYAMAEKRLKNTEKKLLREIELKDAYQTTLSTYLSKGYVKKVKKSKK